MSEDYGADFVTLTDENGEEFELEFLDTIEYDGKLYSAFFPTLEEEDEDSDDFGIIILRYLPGENGEDDMLESVDDEAELDAVYQRFNEILFADEEDEED